MDPVLFGGEAAIATENDNSSSGGAYAYLNYIFYDKNFEDVAKGGFDRTTTSGGNAFESLDLQFIPEKEGYLFVYVSNEEPVARDVYFDDLKIVHKQSIIAQTDSYYPFGLSHGNMSYVREGRGKNQFLYNGKELVEGFDLGWYDYGARNYDATLGRLFTQDRFAEKYYNMNPYQYGANNPITYVDINGDSLTTSAQAQAEKLKNYAEDKIKANNEKMTENAGKGWSEKKLARNNEKLQDENTRYENAINEIGTLESSTQWYNFIDAASEGKGEAGRMTYNEKTEHIDITVNLSQFGLGEVAHEFKHAYQFETGDIVMSLESGNALGALDDIFDEGDANKRSNLFGSTTFTPTSGSKVRTFLRNEGMVNALIKVLDKTPAVFRFNGKTYVVNKE
jgi:RHS repeat-associated protein